MHPKIPNNQQFLVGGAVRDILLGLQPKDLDYVVINKTEQDMLDLGFEQVGKDFPVFLHPKTKNEYALARKERKTGEGYNGFSVITENVTLEEDLFRRDLTINAMAMDSNKNIIDPFGGKTDLQNKTLKHVSHHFSEDPVRILRIARFAARYNFNIHPETMDMISTMVKNGEIDNLTKERVWQEFEKTFTEPYIEVFFQTLSNINAIEKLSGLKNSISDTNAFYKSIKDLEQHQKINTEVLSNEELNTLKSVFVFSNMTNKELNNWAITTELKHVAQLAFSLKETTYLEQSNSNRISFIQKTRALQDPTTARVVCTISLIKQYINNPTYNTEVDSIFKTIEKNLSTLQQDIKAIKTIDNKAIVENATKNKLNISNEIKIAAEIALLQSQKIAEQKLKNLSVKTNKPK